jgi:hypothetical protein
MTLVISPYAPRPAQVAERLRARGVESLIGLPLEPAGYPLNDPGNRALLTGRTLAENNESLEWLLARFPAYVGAIGVVGGMRGERFAAFEQGFLVLQETLRSRGVLFIDARPGVAAPSRAWGPMRVLIAQRRGRARPSARCSPPADPIRAQKGPGVQLTTVRPPGRQRRPEGAHFRHPGDGVTTSNLAAYNYNDCCCQSKTMID